MGMSPLVSITTLNMPDWEVSIKRFSDIVIAAIAIDGTAFPFLSILPSELSATQKDLFFYKKTHWISWKDI